MSHSSEILKPVSPSVARAARRPPPRTPAGDPHQRRPEAPADPGEDAEQPEHADHAGERAGGGDGDGDLRRHVVGCTSRLSIGTLGPDYSASAVVDEGSSFLRPVEVRSEDRPHKRCQPVERCDILGFQMALDTATFKTQTVSLGEPVTFEGKDAEQFLREIKDGPSSERVAELRAAVVAARAVKSNRSANELFR